MNNKSQTTTNEKAPEFTAEKLYQRYADTVFRVAFLRTGSRSDAEDVLQEVFLRYIKRAPEFESEEHAKAWLIRAAINRGNSLMSSAWRRHRADEDDTLYSEMQTESEVYSAVLALPPKYRTVIHLHYYEGYKVGEIAKLMETGEGTVKSWLSRARAELREQLGEEID